MITLYRLVDFVFWFCNLAILLRVLFSWINPDPYNILIRWVYLVTDPILAPLRRIIPPIGGLDLTPMVALVVLELLHRFILSLLF